MYPGNATELGTASLRGSYVGTATAVPQPAQGRVSEGFDQTRKLIESLNMEIGQLEGRLSSVLRPASPSNQTGTDKQRNEPSPLAVSIEGANMQLYALLGYVQSIAARVDL